jgi:thiosulfate/3-mercaptopyruvate sulfurtransferase
VALPADELLRKLTDPFFVVLDVRDRGDWTQNGYEAPPAYRAGHIPHSLPWDPEGLLPGGGRLPDPRSARSRFLLLGVRASARIPPLTTPAVYGEGAGDPRAALAYLLLRGMGFSPRVLSEGFGGWQPAGRPVARIVEAEEVRRLLAGGHAVAIDLRELNDYDAGHIPGAAAIPARHFAEEVAATVRSALPSFNPVADPLVLYCYGRDCLRSHDAAAVAAQTGFRQILWFRDGMDAWRAAGLPVEARQAQAQGPTH